MAIDAPRHCQPEACFCGLLSQGSAAQLNRVAEAFVGAQTPCRITPLGSGNVNATYLLETDGQRQVLQQLNTRVFAKPEAVITNLQVLNAHVQPKIRQLAQCADSLLSQRRWLLPELIKPTDSDQPWYRCENGGFWRCISYVPESRSVDVIEHPAMARELGTGLGLFHQLISDLPAEQLTDTLEGFHITPRYLQLYHRALLHTRVQPSAAVDSCMVFIREREAFAQRLEQAKARGELPLRPIHGDPKINNVLLDQTSGEAIALIDLDTVKPGLVLYDIGDCLRSCCNRLGEETEDEAAVVFDLELAEAILAGYLGQAASCLRPAELRWIPDAARLISFELGLRFFTDHLNGNLYFRADHPEHNLQRALVQFRLAASIEQQFEQLQQLVSRLCGVADRT